MILHYFTKKENAEKIIAKNIYETILYKSNKVLNENSFFIEKNYNISFEIISLLIIMYINSNIKKKIKNYYKINEFLVSYFVSDLDESLRVKGIGDMSIGKYVKSYVKKFYFRLSKFPKVSDEINHDIFVEYLELFNIIESNKYFDASKKFLEIHKIIHSEKY